MGWLLSSYNWYFWPQLVKGPSFFGTSMGSSFEMTRTARDRRLPPWKFFKGCHEKNVARKIEVLNFPASLVKSVDGGFSMHWKYRSIEVPTVLILGEIFDEFTWTSWMTTWLGFLTCTYLYDISTQWKTRSRTEWNPTIFPLHPTYFSHFSPLVLVICGHCLRPHDRHGACAGQGPHRLPAGRRHQHLRPSLRQLRPETAGWAVVFGRCCCRCFGSLYRAYGSKV